MNINQLEQINLTSFTNIETVDLFLRRRFSKAMETFPNPV